MAKTLAERLRDGAQGLSLGADGMGWSPDPALLREAADELERLRAHNAKLAREAHAWWTAARDATVAERERCALRVALHSQYPVQTDFVRGMVDGDGWPKLTKPARVGNGTFGVGVSARLVVEAAQRQHEYHAEDAARTPEQAHEHERKRREAWDMLNGPLGAQLVLGLKTGP